MSKKLPELPSTPRRRSNSSVNSTNIPQCSTADSLPLESVLPLPVLEELSDGMATLDANMQHLQVMHESLVSFAESFSAFLHGIKMNAWCVDFTEAPTSQSFQRDRDEVVVMAQEEEEEKEKQDDRDAEMVDVDTTYMTNDNNSFVVQPSTKKVPTRQASVSTRTLNGNNSRVKAPPNTTRNQAPHSRP